MCVASTYDYRMGFAIVAAILLLLLPLSWFVPLVVLTVFLLPTTYLRIPELLKLGAPATALLLVYGFRNFLAGAKPPQPVGILLALLGALSLLSAVTSTNILRATAFSLLFLALLAVVCCRPLPYTQRATDRTFRATVSILGTYALVEWVTKENPLSQFFAAASYSLRQVWGVYRVFTLLGHPLVNATFFAIAVAYLGSRLSIRFKLLDLALLILSLMAVFFTASRSGLLAAAASVTFVFVRANIRSIRGVIVGVFSISALYALSLTSIGTNLLERNSSAEGVASTAQRLDGLSIAFRALAETGFLGTGLGVSNTVTSRLASQQSSLVLESSLLQLVVGIGIPGTIILIAIYWKMLKPSMARRGPAAAMLVAYLVAASGFNLLEAYPALLSLAVLPILFAANEERASEQCGLVPSEREAYENRNSDLHV